MENTGTDLTDKDLRAIALLRYRDLPGRERVNWVLYALFLVGLLGAFIAPPVWAAVIVLVVLGLCLFVGLREQRRTERYIKEFIAKWKRAHE